MLRRIFCFAFSFYDKFEKWEKKWIYESIYDCDELPKCDCTDLNVDLIIFELILQWIYNLNLIN